MVIIRNVVNLFICTVSKMVVIKIEREELGMVAQSLKKELIASYLLSPINIEDWITLQEPKIKLCKKLFVMLGEEDPTEDILALMVSKIKKELL
jgi:hypothetical protein